MGFYEKCQQVKDAANELSLLSTHEKNSILSAFAEAVETHAQDILQENIKDIQFAREIGKPCAFIDRLTLTQDRVAGMANGIRNVMNLQDPIGETIEQRDLANGIHLKKIRVPLGVIGIIYEARPNVTSDSIALCLKSGNATVLKGGKEAIRTNTIIATLLKKVLKDKGYNENFIYLVEDTSRETTEKLMKNKDMIDVLIPRGSKNLIRAVVETATVPVIETGAGNCHLYIDKYADINKALQITNNAKTQRPSVCNAIETLLVHEDVAEEFLQKLLPSFSTEVEIRGCKKTMQILPTIKEATPTDYDTEYNDYIIAVKIVQDIHQAIAHIRKYSTHHSECIVSENVQNQMLFVNSIDSAAVYVNASTRFTDGEEFGLGAEIGISTQKLHARGPMGLKELTSYKYILLGNGQIRK